MYKKKGLKLDFSREMTHQTKTGMEFLGGVWERETILSHPIQKKQGPVDMVLIEDVGAQSFEFLLREKKKIRITLGIGVFIIKTTDRFAMFTVKI